MKVIHEKRNHIKTYRVTCSCGSLLEYNRNDVEKDDRDGDYIICPICGAYINHHEHFMIQKQNNN